MIANTISSVSWQEAFPLLGVIVLSPVCFFYLFPFDLWYRTLASWKAFDAGKSNNVNDYIQNSQELLSEGLAKVGLHQRSLTYSLLC
jgi:hypothetical protein